MLNKLTCDTAFVGTFFVCFGPIFLLLLWGERVRGGKLKVLEHDLKHEACRPELSSFFTNFNSIVN